MERENAVAAAARVAGGQVELARSLNVSEQAISAWVRRGYVPKARAAEIEEKYGVPRYRLIDPRILELVNPAAV